MPETASPTHHHQSGAAGATCYTVQELAEASPARKPEQPEGRAPTMPPWTTIPTRSPPATCLQTVAGRSTSVPEGLRPPTSRSGCSRPEAAPRSRPQQHLQPSIWTTSRSTTPAAPTTSQHHAGRAGPPASAQPTTTLCLHDSEVPFTNPAFCITRLIRRQLHHG